jgi:hypothetical protein
MQQMWLQRDGTPSRLGRQVTAFLNQQSPDRSIGRFGLLLLLLLLPPPPPPNNSALHHEGVFS